MKPFLSLFTALSFLLVGCADPDEPYTPSRPDIILSLEDAVCDASSVTLTISASGKDLDMFNRWGVTYSESSDKKEGRGLKSTGVPSDGINEIVINGLKEIGQVASPPRGHIEQTLHVHGIINALTLGNKPQSLCLIAFVLL